mmetsp:Transcript_65555/g.165179  ORF Transcript_65555/g.165179 Transcript_65555/m.165179 type:complete len:265 (-) Transcript_65555:219-1013(-)
MYVKFGAIALMRSFKYSASEALYSVSSMTRSASVLMLLRSSSVISVPMEVSAAALTSSWISSGTPTFERSVSLALVFKPMSLTTLAYARFSVTILPISGKCQPYHSRKRMAKLLSSLSRSSSNPTAWMIMVSTLSGENLSLKRESVCARPKDIDFTSSSSKPSMRAVRCILIPRMISFTPSLNTEISIPSFLLMLPPSVLSRTAKLSATPASTMFFFKNFLRLLPTVPSVSSVQASIASFVSLNLWNAVRLTCLAASVLSLNCS